MYALSIFNVNIINQNVGREYAWYDKGVLMRILAFNCYVIMDSLRQGQQRKLLRLHTQSNVNFALSLKTYITCHIYFEAFSIFVIPRQNESQ